MNKSDLVTIRDSIPDDRNFIMATWLRGLKYGNEWFDAIEADVYYSYYQKAIDFILTHNNTAVRVACLKEDPDVILGYVVLNRLGNVVHWVFVKKAWRSIGIAKNLVPETVTRATHLTKVGMAILQKRKGKISFNPFDLT
jgi:GNAT superfamily N-acetyltransferase